MEELPGDKYIVTRALEAFDTAREHFWAWLFDEERNYRRLNIILAFIAGSIITTLAPELWWYAQVAAGTLIIAAFVFAFLIPLAYLSEWVCRRWIV